MSVVISDMEKPGSCKECPLYTCMHNYDDCPIAQAEDVPPAYITIVGWTDEPIVGTEFMTHNQGGRGFEIHFRTDKKEKYEAVQAECRRQIDHGKPADVRPVVSGKWALCLRGEFACTNCGERTKKRTNYCPNCGARMEG